MLIYTLKRLALAAAVTLVVSAMSFGLLYLSGDPAAAIGGEAATDADIANIRKIYGLDRPIHIQYLTWIGKALRGDLRPSSLPWSSPSHSV
jgi:peptide/nickel transport system permease protein